VLEALKGDRAGQLSIRINAQWRICFRWQRGGQGPQDVEIVDYHETGTEIMNRPAVHPREVLADELEEIGVSPTELSRQLAVPANRISQIIQGKQAISGDTALRLGHWFGMSPQFWLNLQSAYDMRIAEKAAGAEIKKLPTRAKTAA
jgi:antitoxin HigA-1